MAKEEREKALPGILICMATYSGAAYLEQQLRIPAQADLPGLPPVCS